MACAQQNSFNVARAAGVAALAAFAAFGMVGCGSRATAPPRTAALASYGAGAGSVDGSVDGGNAAECASYSAQYGTLSGKISTFYPNGPYAGASEDAMRLMVNAVGTDVTGGSGHLIRMFRWRSSGNAYLDSNPLPFQVVSPDDGRVFLGPRTQLSSSDVAQLAAVAGLSSTAAASGVLSRFMFIVGNLDYQWQALKVVVYDSTGARAHEADALIPTFLANPLAYASGRPVELARLHPFYSQRYDSSATDAQWAERARANCF